MKKLLLGLSLLASTAFGASRTADIDYADGIIATRSYIKNGNAEKKGVQGLSAYADSAAAAPVDGTGGAPTATCTRTTSSPLAGDGSFLITHTATNRQGEGCSIPFTIDTTDQAKALQISFDYAVASGTFLGGTDSAVGDLVLYVYDVTNATLIQPSSYKILGSVSGQFYKHQATFQTASNSTSYRLIWHIATSTATAWTWKFDNIKVGPQVSNFGAPVTDWQSFTPVSSWVSNSTHVGYWRRVGDQIEMNVQTTTSGAPTSATYTIALPNGLSIDTAKLGASTSQNQGNGTGYISASSSYITVTPTYNTATTLRIVYSSTLGSLGAVTQALPITWAAANTLSFTARFPVVGWGSSVQLSNDTDTRVVAMQAHVDSGPSILINNVIPYTSVYKDTHGAYNTGTGLYTVPVPGFYRVSLLAAVSSGAGAAYLKQNGTSISFLLSYNSTAVVGGSLVVYCNAGDTLGIYTNVAATLSAYSAPSGNVLSIEKLSGPSQIAASDTVSATLGLTSTYATGGVNAVVKYDTVINDSHNGYSTSTGMYTVPVSGRYQVNVTSLLSSSSSNVYLALNSTGKIYLASAVSTGFVAGSTIYKFNAGDTLSIFSAASVTFSAISGGIFQNTLSIVRVGN